MILSTGYYQVALQWHIIISGLHIWHILNYKLFAIYTGKYFYPPSQGLANFGLLAGIFWETKIVICRNAPSGRKYSSGELIEIQGGSSETRKNQVTRSHSIQTRRIYHSAMLPAAVGKHKSQLNYKERLDN